MVKTMYRNLLLCPTPPSRLPARLPPALLPPAPRHQAPRHQVPPHLLPLAAATLNICLLPPPPLLDCQLQAPP